MPKVICDTTTCEYCRKNGENEFICGRDEVELFGGECATFEAHVYMSPEYRETFWKRISSRTDRHECKLKAVNGKRYEMAGHVWFTEDDDRWGTDELWFTEQRSGLRIQGKDITEERAAFVKEKVESICPVTDLPEATWEDV